MKENGVVIILILWYLFFEYVVQKLELYYFNYFIFCYCVLLFILTNISNNRLIVVV